MAKQVAPLKQLQFGGVVTAGNPLARPPDSSVVCRNFRIMPGNWTRLRGGRLARMHQAAGKFLQIREFRAPAGYGWISHPAQHFDGTATTSWRWLTLDPWVFDPFFSEPISGAHDGNFSQNNQAAIAMLRDRMVLYNGLGVRDANSSRPPFSSGQSSALRYFGLDAYAPAGNPSASFATGAGNNQVITSVRIYVGLHNTETQHYSNGIFCGEISSTETSGTITVSDLDKLKFASHNATEQNELKYVFYATIDGGRVPYLILDNTGIQPYTVAVSSTSASLSLVPGTINGWFLDLTSEMPISNHPPRPMRSIASVNGRVYGILMDGGAGTAVMQEGVDGRSRSDFTYQPDYRQFAGVVYSVAAGDSVDQERIGAPEESWPLSNFSPTPNSEFPLRVEAAPDSVPDSERLLVLCRHSCFYADEAPDGIHEWTRISSFHGLGVPETLVRTPHGVMWLTQRKQLVILEPGATLLRILSSGFQSLLDGKTPQGAGYTLDPLNEVDRYEVFFTDGSSLVYDFAIGGQAYTATNRDFLFATTLTNILGTQYHVLAKQHLYTQEGQPEDGKVVTFDQDFTGPTTTSNGEISGVYEFQWNDFGDNSLTKDLPHLDVIGDERLMVDWWADLEDVNDSTLKMTLVEKTVQSETDLKYRFSLSEAERFWFKFRLSLTGRSQEQSRYLNPGDQASMRASLYGAVAEIQYTASVIGENRP